MKKTMAVLSIIGITFLLALPTVTIAKEAKPDKSPCFLMDGGGVGYFDQDVILLGAKSSGITGKDIDGKVKLYNVNGVIYNSDFPGENPTISGSVYYNYQGFLFYHFNGYVLGNAFGCNAGIYDEEWGQAPRAICSYGGEPYSAYTLIEVECKDYDFNSSAIPEAASQLSEAISDPTSLTPR